MTMIYYEDNGDVGFLNGKTVGVIGYDSLARAMALNLRDSGVNVMVSVLNGEQSTRAEEDIIPIVNAAEATRRSHIVLVMMPDEIMPAIYMGSVSPHLQRGHTLLFASSYNVAFGYIEPPPFVDYGLVSPRIYGDGVRERYLSGEGYHSFLAVGQDASRNTWQTVLAVAQGIGALRGGAVEVLMEQEAELSLFIQQAVIPAFHHIMVTAANLLMNSGYPPEAALPDLYLSGKFNDYLKRADSTGLLNAIQQASLTAQYATLSRLDRFSELKLERLMEVTLEEIQTGEFAKEWSREHTDGHPRLQKLLKTQEKMDMWEWEQQALELLGRER
jgi:ketol-acid reductoisomerase